VIARSVLLAALLIIAACRLDAEDSTPSTDTGADLGDSASRCLLVTTTEFRTDGALAVINADTLEVWPDVTATHSDARIRSLDGRVFILNRQGGDSVQELDPGDGYRTLSQRSVGRGTNPWGIADAGDGSAWVALYSEGALQRVDLDADSETDFRVGDPIPLPAPAEADGRAEPIDLFVHDDVLYVIAQGLGEYPQCAAGSRAHLHAFDPATGTPLPVFDGESSLQLAACNTSSYSLEPDGTLWLAHSGVHRVNGDPTNDGGVERVDLATGTSAGLVIDEAALNGQDVIQLVVDEREAWIAIAGEDFTASVRRWDVEAGEVGPAVWESDSGGVFDLDLAFGRLWVVDRSHEHPGVVAIDLASDEVIVGPIDTGFPPFDLMGFEREGGCEP
jgi:streptogramin lyase